MQALQEGVGEKIGRDIRQTGAAGTPYGFHSWKLRTASRRLGMYRRRPRPKREDPRSKNQALLRMTRILVLCTGNSCRSQMAEGWLRRYLGSRAEIRSAGIRPDGLNPYAVRVMAESGIDIGGQTSNSVEEYRETPFDYFLSLCDGALQRCPPLRSPGTHIHAPLPDPADATGTEEEVMAVYRQSCDEIRQFAKEFARRFAEEFSERSPNDPDGQSE